MSKNVTGSNTWQANVRCPTTGDAVDQPAWENGRTDLADRTMYLYTTGSSRLRTVASTGALTALTGMVAGDLAMISSVGRLYQFRTTEPAMTTAGESYAPYAYAADDSSGFWYSAEPNEVKTMETQSVAAGTVDFIISAWQAITGDTNWHDIAAGAVLMSVTLVEDVLEDDIIEVYGRMQSIGDGVNAGVYRAVVVYDATVYEVAGSGAYQGASTDASTVVCAGRYVMPAGKSGVVVKLQGKVAAAGGTLTVGDIGIHFAVKVLRRPG